MYTICNYRVTILQCVLFFMSINVECRAGELKIIKNSLGMEMVAIPEGDFSIGNEKYLEEIIDAILIGQHDLDPALEKSIWTVKFRKDMPNPQRACARAAIVPYWEKAQRVVIDRAFYIGKHPVTLGQFLTFYHDSKCKLQVEHEGERSYEYAFVGGQRAKIASNRPWSPGWKIEMNHPVVYVSWLDAVAFCEWLSTKEGKKYRLPTEIEWEYVCRAGSQSLYHFGNNLNEYRHRNLLDGTAQPFTLPVGSFVPNGFGVCDLHGNVTEWCKEAFNDNYVQSGYKEMEPKYGVTGPHRINRSGGIFIRGEEPKDGLFKRTQYRKWHETTCHFDLGFRVVCEDP